MLNALQQEELQEINQKENFEIKDLEGANWCFRKIRVLQQKIEGNKALADAERERIASWESKENKAAEENIEYFEDLLKAYYIEQKAKDKKFKLTSPYGKVSSRKNKKWTYKNEKQVLEYLKENEYTNLIRVKEEINKTELKRLFTDGVDVITGEVLPGVNIAEEENILINIE